MPKAFSIPPTAELAKAKALLDRGNFDEARAAFKEIIDNEGHTLLKAEEAIVVLAGYARSIKQSLRRLSLEDWEEVRRSLSILVRDYSQNEGFNPEFARDMAVAARQIAKLQNPTPRAGNEQ